MTTVDWQSTADYSFYPWYDDKSTEKWRIHFSFTYAGRYIYLCIGFRLCIVHYISTMEYEKDVRVISVHLARYHES